VAPTPDPGSHGGALIGSFRIAARRCGKTVAKWLLRQGSLRLHGVIGVMPAWAYALRELKARGFAPRTIFDIGVADGTPDLYAAFPKAKYYLIDPTRESLPHMQRIVRKLDARIVNLALGDREDEQAIAVRCDDIGGSTFFDEVGPLGPIRRYVVTVRRFDQVVDGFDRPALCKIDVQGAEMSVLRGMGERIHDIDAVIVESSVLATLKGGPEIAEVIAYMHGRGFALYDVLGGARRPLDRALAQLDLLFVKEDSALRADRRWASV
jgi:FkbM family methyltransferase